MKSSFRVRVLALVMTFALFSSALHAAEYLVVIGAFSDESNARRFTGTMRKFFKEVSYSFNEEKKLYYVHVLKTSRKEEARNWSLYLRNEKGFKDAWVLTALEATAENLAGEDSGSQGTQLMSQRTDARYSSAVAYSPLTSEQGNITAGDVARADKTNAWTMSYGLGFINNIKNIKSFKSQSPDASTNLFRFTVQNHKGQVIPSEVMLVNFEKVKKIATFQTGEYVGIKGTKPKQMVTFVCDVLGFSQETRIFNLDHLSRSKDIRKNEDGVWEVTIKLKKMDPYDIAIMNKTFFYKDAAILEPSSQKELDELVVFMNNNPGYGIMLHSHCNPGTARSIKFRPDDHTWFELDGAIEKEGSDKLLTKKRAELVKDYLVQHGIDKKRIRTVAWGSMETIVKSTSEDAYINERIEVEVTVK